MITRFLSGAGVVWPTITKAVRSAARADVAVAYFGEGGARRLPLKPGSRLVVDVSLNALRNGVTSPAELLKLVHKGVEVYDCPGLHAKIFVLPKKAFIGSTNVSSNSASNLIEAALLTTDSKIVHDARAFIMGLLLNRLGPMELTRRKQDFRPPKPRRPPGKRPATAPRVLFHYFSYEDPPSVSDTPYAQGLAEAKQKLTKGYVLEDSWESGTPYRLNDTLIYATEGIGKRRMVTPPARVINVKQWSNGRASYSFTYTERPKGNCIELGRLARSLGRGWKKRLSRSSRLNREMAGEFLAWWHR